MGWELGPTTTVTFSRATGEEPLPGAAGEPEVLAAANLLTPASFGDGAIGKLDTPVAPGPFGAAASERATRLPPPTITKSGRST